MTRKLETVLKNGVEDIDKAINMLERAREGMLKSDLDNLDENESYNRGFSKGLSVGREIGYDAGFDAAMSLDSTYTDDEYYY